MVLQIVDVLASNHSIFENLFLELIITVPVQMGSTIN